MISRVMLKGRKKTGSKKSAAANAAQRAEIVAALIASIGDGRDGIRSAVMEEAGLATGVTPEELLRLEVKSLRTELAFKNQIITLLGQINANLQASLKTFEVYYIILTGITAAPGLGFNRAMLFVKNPETGQLEGVLALSPDSFAELHRYYEDAAEHKYGLDHYIRQLYENNFQVKNRLHRQVTALSIPARATNILTETMQSRKARYVRRPRSGDFRGVAALGKIMRGGEFVIAPVVSGSHPLGVLIADNYYTKRHVTPEEAASLQMLGKFAGSMIASARKAEEAELNSVYDELTLAVNGRRFEDTLRHEIERGRRYRRRFSVCLIDVDDFRRFNELNGHLKGNKALIDLVRLVKSNVRNVDTLARFGGDKFVVLLPETGRAGAMTTAEKIRSLIRAKKFMGASVMPGKRLTVSMGLATYPDDGEDFLSVLGCLRKNLHLAKASGKDSVKA
jgi:diguanylate cyclase (GGDEF)-like protein